MSEPKRMTAEQRDDLRRSLEEAGDVAAKYHIVTLNCLDEAEADIAELEEQRTDYAVEVEELQLEARGLETSDREYANQVREMRDAYEHVVGLKDELEADGRRLDWLDQWSPESLYYAIGIPLKVSHDSEGVRQAIDAAMKEQNDGKAD